MVQPTRQLADDVLLLQATGCVPVPQFAEILVTCLVLAER
jgi:hypothetical protein